MSKLEPAVCDKLSRKRLIFTVSTGRNGSAYLSTVMNFCPGVVALHEPTPDYVEVLRPAQSDVEVAKRFLIEKKLPIVAEFPTSIYLEGSHLFCKGFLEPCHELGIVPDIIYFKRDIRKVSCSLLKMGTIPGRSEKALRYYLSPGDPTVVSIRGWKSLTDYQLCFWYCLEIERRAEVYRKLYDQLPQRFVEASIEQLKTISGYRKLLVELDLPPMRILNWLRYLKYRNTKINESFETKKQIVMPENMKEQEEEVIGLMNKTLN